MRVAAVQNIYYPTFNTLKPVSANRTYRNYGINSILQYPQSNPSFGSIKNAEGLRALMQYGIPDMYTGKMTIPSGLFENLLKSGVFSAPARYSVKFLKIFENTFSEIPYKVFQQIKKRAQHHPDDDLQEIMQALSVENKKSLRKRQTDIFNNLKELSEKLPPKAKASFKTLMDKTQDQLDDKPIVSPFSKATFQYNLRKIHDDIRDLTNKRTANFVVKMIEESDKMPDISDINSKDKQKEIINNLIKIAQSHSYLRSYKPLNELLLSSISNLDKEPVVIPFSRKTFIYRLDKILDGVKNQKLKEQMHNIAETLPTSKNGVDAYILKFKDSPSDKIAFRLAHLSYSSVEHRRPKSKGGKDSMKNYAVASVEENSARGNIDYKEQMKRRPNTAKNNQKQIDRLIQLANRGKFKKLRVDTKYIRDYKQYTAQESKGEILLDISKLKEDA